MLDLTQTQLKELNLAALEQNAAINPNGDIGWSQLEAAVLIGPEHYLYQRKVGDDPLKFRYKYLSPQTLAQAFNLKTIDSGWIDHNIVRTGSNGKGNWAVLWVPRQKHQIGISDAGQDGADLTLNVPLPAMVMVGINQDYRLCAVSKTKFDPKNQAMIPPLPNVSGYDGKICWGSNNPPEASAQTLPQAWRMFISSLFSDHNLTNRSNKFPRNIIDQLKAVNGRRSYPQKDLLAFDRYSDTIEDFLKRILDL